METAKLTRGATVADRILKILQGFAMAGVIVAAIFIPLTLILGQKIVADASTVELGVLKIRLTGDPAAYLDAANLKASIVCVLVCLIVASAAVWYCLRVLRETLAPMKAGTPFAAGISGKIRKLAWSVLIGGGVAEIGSVAADIFEMRAYQIDRFLNMDLISAVTYDWDVNLWFLGVALLLFFLSFVFRYGEELQREADETL
ncbi:MAG: hypothetical protein IJK64_00370 [Clostridia bacterium]|nr:hypothetical protein [Clostridia bacterium]